MEKEIRKIIKENFSNGIILCKTGRGKPFSPFIVEHNLIGLTDEQLKDRLELLVHDQNSTEEVRSRAKSILSNLTK